MNIDNGVDLMLKVLDDMYEEKCINLKRNNEDLFIIKNLRHQIVNIIRTMKYTSNKQGWVDISQPPEKERTYDVTVEFVGGDRVVTIAYLHRSDIWEFLIDKHHFDRAIIKAWRERPLVYWGETTHE